MIENIKSNNLNELVVQYKNCTNMLRKNELMCMIVQQADKMANEFIKKIVVKGMDYEDKLQEFRTVFVNCLNKYDVSKNKFSTLLHHAYNNKVMQIIELQNTCKRKGSHLDIHYETEIPTHYNKYEIDFVGNVNTRIAFQKLLPKLNDKQKALIYCSLNGYKDKEAPMVFPHLFKGKTTHFEYQKNKTKQLFNELLREEIEIDN